MKWWKGKNVRRKEQQNFNKWKAYRIWEDKPWEYLKAKIFRQKKHPLQKS